jgi:hypothetical protein
MPCKHLIFRIVLTRGGGAGAGDLRVVIDAEGYRRAPWSKAAAAR